MRTIVLGSTDPNNWKVYFYVKLLDGNPSLVEAGQQPKFQINSSGWNTVGISPLVSQGFGNYSADLDPGISVVVGDIILTDYLNSLGTTIDAPGDIFQVISGSTIMPEASVPSLAYNSYVQVAEGDEYFNARVNSPLWFGSSPSQKLTALRHATRLIDRLNFRGDKADPKQLLEFPRGNTVVIVNPQSLTNPLTTQHSQDIAVPIGIRFACCEIAYKLLDEVDPDSEIDALFTESQGYANIKTVYNRKVVPDYMMAGIPSAIAWSYLLPYLRDPREITINRLS